MEPACRRRASGRSILSSLFFLFTVSLAKAYVSTGDAAGSTLKLPTARPLRPRCPGAGFRIALFADLHYGENAWTDWGPAQDSNSDRVMATALDAETPDFVVYLGDLVTANNVPIANASAYWDRAVSAARSRGLPWASVFGNHDDMHFEWPSEWFSAAGVPQVVCAAYNGSSPASDSEGDCSFKGTTRVQLMANELKSNELSHSETGPKELWPSVSNYMLQVVSSKDPQSAIALLYFLDSGGGSYPEVISSSQVRWFEKLSQTANPESSIPEIIFWHIPSIAYKKVAPSRIFRIRKPCVGSINKENVAAQGAEWGIMDVLEKRASVKAVFVGHNHGLDWCCPSKNLWLCFARHTGHGGYGDWPRGARIIEITEEPFSLKSWIRMEDGSNHSYIDLSGHP